MNFSKNAPLSALELDMTPMVDMVFQLIIFFMLITDMSQLELSEVNLPTAQVAVTDKPDPKQIRPVLNITSAGTITVKNVVLFDPRHNDQYKALKEYLVGVARLMPTAPLDKNVPGSPRIPANPLLIRADQSTPAKYIQRVMEICGTAGIQIWKVELGAKTESETPATGVKHP